MLLASLLSVALFALTATATSHPHNKLAKRARLAYPLGLSASNLKKGSISLGFLPAFGEPLEPSTITSLNKLLPAPMAVVGTYARISTKDMSMSTLDGQVAELVRQNGTKPVFAIALGVDSGLASVNQRMANAIAAKMLAIEKQGVTVWLRFLWEMNGDWYAWGGQPAAFQKAWKLVYTTVHKSTTRTHMLWSPNSAFATDAEGGLKAVRGGWTPYFPGANYVDLTGLSFYHYGGFDRGNQPPPKNEAVNQLKKFDALYGSKIRKYFVLSETSASYTVDVNTGVRAPGGASAYQIHTEWFRQIISTATQRAVPWFRAAVFFEIIKDENAGGNSPIKRLDFRILADPPTRKAVLGSL